MTDYWNYELNLWSTYSFVSHQLLDKLLLWMGVFMFDCYSPVFICESLHKTKWGCRLGRGTPPSVLLFWQGLTGVFVVRRLILWTRCLSQEAPLPFGSPHLPALNLNDCGHYVFRLPKLDSCHRFFTAAICIASPDIFYDSELPKLILITPFLMFSYSTFNTPSLQGKLALPHYFEILKCN